MELMTSSSRAALLAAVRCDRSRIASPLLLSPKSGGFRGPLYFIASGMAAHKKSTLMGAFFMELMTRFELVTSSLPRTRSAY